jgi:hypothetical protein
MTMGYIDNGLYRLIDPFIDIPLATRGAKTTLSGKRDFLSLMTPGANILCIPLGWVSTTNHFFNRFYYRFPGAL